MSTILFFTSDRFAFANLSPSATTEKIILTPDPVDGSRLFIGNSTMISYDVRCNISTFDGSRATMTIDTLNNRVGIGISSPTVALDIVDAGGVRIVGPTNITGATTFTGNSRVIGVATATSFTGSGIGLTSIPAARIVGSLPAAVFANATIPVAALSGYDNGSLLLSGHLKTETLNVSTISTQHIIFSSLSGGNAEIDTLSVRSFSTAFGFVSTLTIGRLLAGSISSGSIGSLVTDSGSFNFITAGTAGINVLNTALLSTGAGTASSFTVGILYAATISSGSLISLSSGLVSVSNTGVTNSANITTISNNLTTVSNAGATNTTNITTVSNTVNYLLAVSNISAVTMSTSFGFFSTISTGTVFGRFVGDGSLLTNLPVTAALTTISNTGNTNATNITTVSNTVNYLLAVSNISAVTMSTSFGFFSTISAGTIFGRFLGDGSLLTNLPVTTALTTVSNTGTTNTTNITIVSNTVNYLLAVSNISAVTMSTSFGFFSTISTGTVFGRFVGDGSLLTNLPVTTALTTVSNTGNTNATNITTVSNTVNYLLAVSNISAVTMSTSFGFFSTISTGTVFGRFVGDGSLLTNLPVTAALTTISNAGTSNTTNITTVSNTVNYLLAVSNISAVTMSTSYGFFSTISTGTVFGRFVGDGSGLTGIGGISIVPPVLSTTLLSTGILTARNISTTTISTSYGFFSTISAGTIYARFVGDGSGLTGISGGGGISIVPPILSTTLLSTGILTASNISTVVISTNAGFASSFFINRLTTSTVTALLGSFSSISVGQAYISSLTVDSLFIGNDIGFTNMGDIIATSLSTIQVTTGNLIAINTSTTTTSTNYGFFSTISAGRIFGRFVGDGSGLTGIASGGISIVPPVLSTTLLSTGNLTACNISVGVISTIYGFFSTISAGTVFGRFVGDGSLLTNLPVTAAITTVSNSLITVSNTVNYLLAVSNISAVTMSTSFGFFSTISAGTVFGRFVGDGSSLTNLPVTAALTTVSNAGATNTTNITTVSNSVTVVSNTVNYLLAVSNISAVTMSTSFGFFSTISAGTVFGRFIGDGSLLTNLPVTTALATVSNNLTTVSNSGSTNTTNITTVSNTVNYLLAVSNISAVTMSTSFGFFSTISAGTVFGRFVGDGSLLTNLPVTTALATVSNTGSTNTTNITTVSNTVNYLLTVSNISAVTMSTSFGFFSTISAGTVFGRFVGDGSLLTNLPVTTALATVSNTGSTNTTNITTVSNTVNYLLAVSNISAVTMSTSFGFFSTISAGTVFGRFVGDGSLLTNLPVTAALTTISNTGNTNATNITTVSNTVNYLLAVSNISAVTMSTSFGFFSTISAGTVFGRFVGDGSLLTNLPVTTALATVSNNLTTVSNTGSTNTTNITTVSNTVNYLLAVSNISAVTMSTSFGFFSTISAGTVFGRFVGDGSLLTGIVGASGGISFVPPILSTTLLSTGILTARSISTTVISSGFGFFSTISAGTVFGRFVGDGSLLTNLPVAGVSVLSTQAFFTSSISSANITSAQGYISSLIVDVLSFGLSNSYISMGDVIATSISTIQTFTSSLLTINLQVGNVSSLSYIAFPGLQQGYTQSIIAEQSTGTGFQELLFYKGSTTTDRIRMQTTGSIVFEPGVSARVFPAVGSNVTPAMIINASSNVGIGIAVPTVALDVAGTGRFQMLSTQQLFVSSISSGLVYGRFAGDGSLLTGIVGAGGGLSYIPPVLSTTLLSTGNLTASTINTDILNTRLFSTASGTASTFTIGNIFGSSGSISSIIGNEAKISTVTANTLSSYIVYASSINTPNIYVTNIYANDGGIANVVASSLNASRAVFVQVIASSFQGSLIGKNLLTVETY